MNKNNDLFLSDEELCQLYVGSKEPGRAGEHWLKMIANPEEKTSCWHEAQPFKMEEESSNEVL